jgi:hypothetical protein
MARRVYLHIGPPKTGTTFLQAAWFQHRDDLADRGVLYAGDHRLDQFRASAVLLGKTRVTERMPPRQLAAWDRIASATREWQGDAILSGEHYALASRRRAAEILEKVGALGDEVHVVVTARDLARQVPAAWQQGVKEGSAETFDDYWRGLSTDPSRGFWQAQDLPQMLARWSQGIPAERVHLVVHGAPGSPHDLLWRRLCEVTGVDPTILGSIDRANESLGVVQIELLRRINAELPEDRDTLEMGRLTKGAITTQVLVHTEAPTAIAIPDDAWSWLQERSSAMAERLASRGYDVVGDLADLVPQERRSGGVTPGAVSDTDVARVAAQAFALMLVRDLERTQELRSARAVNRP